jgi:hypothetical protein
LPLFCVALTKVDRMTVTRRMIKKALVMTDSCLVFNAKISPDGNPTPGAPNQSAKRLRIRAGIAAEGAASA